jgi:hypothetical protein
MEKLARIVTGVFGAWHSHVWARSVTVLKISKGELIKVTIGLTEPMRMGDMIRCLLVSQRSGKIYNLVQRSSRRFQGYNSFNSGFKGITS